MSDLPHYLASPAASPAASATPFRYRLSTRIVTLSGVALALVLSMIAGTLWLSWQLEGAGAAINDASQRAPRGAPAIAGQSRARTAGVASVKTRASEAA